MPAVTLYPAARLRLSTSVPATTDVHMVQLTTAQAGKSPVLRLKDEWLTAKDHVALCLPIASGCTGVQAQALPQAGVRVGHVLQAVQRRLLCSTLRVGDPDIYICGLFIQFVRMSTPTVHPWPAIAAQEGLAASDHAALACLLDRRALQRQNGWSVESELRQVECSAHDAAAAAAVAAAPGWRLASSTSFAALSG